MGPTCLLPTMWGLVACAGRSHQCWGALLSPSSGWGCQQPLQGSDILFPVWWQGEENWRRSQCLQVGNAYVIVYSITDRGSFESASELRIQLRRTRQAEDIPIILVGNKTDLVRCREVSVEGEWWWWGGLAGGDAQGGPYARPPCPAASPTSLPLSLEVQPLPRLWLCPSPGVPAGPCPPSLPFPCRGPCLRRGV